MLPPHIQVRKDISVAGGSGSMSGERSFLAAINPAAQSEQER
jgi:hypothetical protein